MAINNYFNATPVSIDFNAVKQVDSKPAASGFADGNIIFDKTEQQFYQALSSSWIALDFIGDDFTVNKLAFNTAATETLATGELAWNADDETVDMHVGDDVTIQLGQEMVYHVVNQTGSQIDNGTVVMADGALGASGKIKVVPAIADGSVPAKYIMGVATEDIPNGALGYVTAFGKVRGFDTSSYSSGTVLYASATSSGSFTDTSPSLPNQKVTVAITLDQKSNGNIFVRPTYDDRRKSVSSISDLENVNTTENDVVYLNSGGRSGWFKWDGSNLSTKVTADSGQGIYVAPSSDATGASGAWKREYDSVTSVEWWGAIGDGVTDDTTAITNAISAVAATDEPVQTIAFLEGNYLVTSLNINQSVHLLGQGRQSTKITVSSEATDADTSEKYAVALAGSTSEGLSSVVRLTGIEIELTTATPNVHGLLVRRKSFLEDVYVHEATGDGIHFNTDAANNASFFSIFRNTWSKNNTGYGCNLQRGANANIFVNCQFDNNGIDGFIQRVNGIAINGNIVIGGQASFNSERGFNIDGGTNFAMIGPYAEFNGDGLTAPNWSSGTSYTSGNLVTSPSSGLTEAQTSVVYQAASNHTSSTSFDDDYVAVLWEPYGTEMRVSNSVTYSNINLGLALSNKTDRIRNENSQITTKVMLGGSYINQENQELPYFQRLQFRDGARFGQNSGDNNNEYAVAASGQFNMYFNEANSNVFAIRYDGSNASPTNQLKFVALDVTGSGGGELDLITLQQNSRLGFFGATPSIQSTGWSAANVTPDKSFDANTVNVSELADVVGTLIDELKTKGLLGG